MRTIRVGGRLFGKALALALAALPSKTCDYEGCAEAAAALLQKRRGYGFVCAGHARVADRLGFRVIRRRGGQDVV